MTSLEEGTERSEIIYMLSVPAKMVILDLLQLPGRLLPGHRADVRHPRQRQHAQPVNVNVNTVTVNISVEFI